jgi:predicted SAM-dependent methyltransferase
MKKLNLGCGAETPKGWLNVDYAPGAKLAKIPGIKFLGITSLQWNKDIFIHNLLTPFPWENESVDVIYTSHTLEHFTREDGKQFLKESFRVLKKNGIIRIVVPDLKAIVNDYLEGKIRADHFVEDLWVLYPVQNNFFKKLLNPVFSFPHKCMYDSKTLIEVLEEIGFDTKERKSLDSDIADIKDIELIDRTEDAVIVEGVKK